MNEFVAKKLGEVLAFCKIGRETINKGREALESVFGKDKVLEMAGSLEYHAMEIEEIVQAGASSDITLAKSVATGKKLAEMRDLYIGAEWENPTELLEWHGFFEGAAMVHWQLVLGAGTATGDKVLQVLASEAIDFHKTLLAEVSELLRNTGRDKAKLQG